MGADAGDLISTCPPRVLTSSSIQREKPKSALPHPKPTLMETEALTERDKIYLEETSKQVEERQQRDAIFREELEARRAMERAQKQRQQRIDSELREASLKAAIADKEASLARVKSLILERKGAAAKLRDEQEEARKQRIDQCIQESEVCSHHHLQ